MRVPQPDIIEHFGNADAVPQLPERCYAARRELCGVALGLAGVEYAQPAADLLAFALALPMGLSVLKTFRSDAPTPAHTLREE